MADLRGALGQDLARSRDVLRATMGEVTLAPEGAELYAEFENTAERLALAVGGAKMGRVAGEGFEPSTFGL